MLLLHGDSDMVVSPNYLLEAQDFLLRNQVDVKINMIKNCQILKGNMIKSSFITSTMGVSYKLKLNKNI